MDYQMTVCVHYLCTCECCGINFSGEATDKGAVVVDPGAIHLLTVCHKHPTAGYQQPCLAGSSLPAVIDLGLVSVHAARMRPECSMEPLSNYNKPHGRARLMHCC